ncbi:MAG: hypothetical protein AB1757_30170 [Acidobacteriota bacterium]
MAKNKLSFITLITLLIFSSLATDAKNKRKPLRLTEKDKAQIIEFILRKELSQEKYSSFEKFLFCHNEFLTPNLIPQIFKNKVIVIQSNNRQEETQKGDTFNFDEVKIKSSKVEIVFSYTADASKYFHRKTTTYEFQKIQGR